MGSADAGVDLPPELEERYEGVAALGEGGSARVFRARRREDGLEVVLKLLDLRGTEEAEDAEEARARFEEEARVLEALDHPRVVRLLEHGVAGTEQFLSYRFEEGETLEDLLAREGALGAARVAALLDEVLEALEAVHAVGVVHRDLKPGNVLLVEGAGAKLMDFGIAHGLEGRQVRTRTGEWVGTPEYAAPNHLKGEGPDPRDDLYSLGVVAYEMLAGENPFRDKGPVRTVRRQLNHMPGLPEGAPRGLGFFVLGLLAKRREDRPEDAGAARRALAEAGGGEGREETSAVLESRKVVASGVRARGRPATARARWGPVAGVVGAGLAVGLAAAALVWGPGGEAPSGQAGGPGRGEPPPLLVDPLYLEDLRAEVAALGEGVDVEEARRDPLAYGKVLEALPSARAFHAWVEVGGQAAKLDEAIVRALRSVDREVEALGWMAPFGPLLDEPAEGRVFEDMEALRELVAFELEAPRFPARLEGEAAAAAEALLEVARVREGAQAELAARPAGPFPAGIEFPLGVAATGSEVLWSFTTRVGVIPDNRARLYRWLGDGSRALRRALAHAGQAARQGGEGAEVVALALRHVGVRLSPFYCSPLIALEPEVALAGPVEGGAAAFLAVGHLRRRWRMRVATGTEQAIDGGVEGVLREAMAAAERALAGEPRGPWARARRGAALAELVGLALDLGDEALAGEVVRERLGEILAGRGDPRREALLEVAEMVAGRGWRLGLGRAARVELMQAMGEMEALSRENLAARLEAGREELGERVRGG